MRTKNPIDFLKILNANLAENPVYRDLFKVTSELIDKQITEPLSQLVRARSAQHIQRGDYVKVDERNMGRVVHVARGVPTELDGVTQDAVTFQLPSGHFITQEMPVLQDRKTLVDGARMLGFNYYSEYLTDEDYSRVFDYISGYWNANGQPDFIKFMGFIKDLNLSMDTLWTKDQGDNATSDDPDLNFYEYLEPQNETTVPVYRGGHDYPTSHVAITVDGIEPRPFEFDELISLFYLFAPIHLVLHRIIRSVTVYIETEVNVAAHYNVSDQSIYKWDPSPVLGEIVFAATDNLSIFDTSKIVLDEELMVVV